MTAANRTEEALLGNGAFQSQRTADQRQGDSTLKDLNARSILLFFSPVWGKWQGKLRGDIGR